MKKNSMNIFLAMVLAAMFLAPMSVYADNTYTLTNTTYSNINPLSITYNTILDPGGIHTAANEAGTTGKFVTESTLATPLYLKIALNGQALNSGNWFTSFCVDIYQNIWGGASGAVSMIPVSSVQGGLQAAWLYNNYLDNAVKANDTAALGGLQVAIWEAITDPNDYNLSKGNFYVSGLNATALADANSMLANLKTNFSSTGLNSMYAIMHTAALQDQLVKLSGIGVDPPVGDPPAGTPEPATMVLMGIGLLGLAGIKKFRKN